MGRVVRAQMDRMEQRSMPTEPVAAALAAVG